MTMHYSQSEADYLKRQQEKRAANAVSDDAIELVRCADGVYRTRAEAVSEPAQLGAS